MSKVSPFDFIKSINEKTHIDEELLSDYNAFIINRSLSYHYDCILYVNEMNRYHQLDNDMQFSFLNGTIKKKKRWAKWEKKENLEDIGVIQTFYKVNSIRALEILKLLNSEQIDVLKEKLTYGGRRK